MSEKRPWEQGKLFKGKWEDAELLYLSLDRYFYSLSSNFTYLIRGGMADAKRTHSYFFGSTYTGIIMQL